MTICDDAVEAHRCGLCVVPPREDGSKAPADTWKQYQTVRPTIDQLTAWYTNGRAGLGLICGVVSGHLEMFEFEGRAVQAGIKDRFIDQCEAAGLGDTITRIATGYAERTPSGGIHLLWRCPDGVTGNLKLARRLATADELADDPGDKFKVLIETRGEAGYTIVAPTNGTVHPTGKPWQILAGEFATIATITAEERAALLDVARSFDEIPRPEYQPPTTPTEQSGDRPGDWYNANTTWADVLVPAGWTLIARYGDEDEWRRPGKTIGSSARTNHQGRDLLRVFSTSTVFDTERSYNKFQAYTFIHHGGDFTASATAIRRDRMPADTTTRVESLESLIAPVAPTAKPVADTAEPGGLDLRAVTGGRFILDQPPGIPAVWGNDDQVLWAEGEPFLLVGPQGVGKTTISGQLVMARIGLIDCVLERPVKPGQARVLYFACDRPRQVARAFARHVDRSDRETLDRRLVFWPGPPPGDLAKHPEILLRMAEHFDADTVFIDSLKDAAIGLNDDEVGAGLNRAFQGCIAAGVEVVGNHHQRKGQAGSKPKTLEDVYGSTWVTAGCGSIVLLWGQPGDPIVELTHLKQPGAEVGPLKVEHDHNRGTSTVFSGYDPLRALRNMPSGLTATHSAQLATEKQTVTDNDRKKAKRRLEDLVQKGLARREDGTPGGPGGTDSDRYFAVDNVPPVAP